MNINVVEEDHSVVKSLKNLINGTRPEDISIDIFGESMTDYIQKLNAASAGRYELDDYDMQVIAIAMEQYAICLTGNLRK